MVSKSASVIGPLVPRPTTTSPPSFPCALIELRRDSPSDHCRLTAASTSAPGRAKRKGSW